MVTYFFPWLLISSVSLHIFNMLLSHSFCLGQYLGLNSGFELALARQAFYHMSRGPALFSHSLHLL
jgi:hypothetical protein